MQGYLVVRHDRKTALWMTDCSWEIALDDPGSMRVDRQIACRAKERQPGVYHLSVKLEGKHISTVIGSQIKDVSRLIGKLGDKARMGYGAASTGAPGIEGFQHCEDMSNASLHARKMRAATHASALAEEMEGRFWRRPVGWVLI